jgi:hypothetical protein
MALHKKCKIYFLKIFLSPLTDLYIPQLINYLNKYPLSSGGKLLFWRGCPGSGCGWGYGNGAEACVEHATGRQETGIVMAGIFQGVEGQRVGQRESHIGKNGWIAWSAALMLI